MGLVSLQGVRLAFGGPQILAGIDLQIDAGERVCLVGRNGEGKSTIMKLLTGELVPDQGEISRQQGLRVAMLPQEVSKTLTGSVFDTVAEGLGPKGELLKEFHSISHRLADPQDDRLMRRLEQVQHALDVDHGWEMHRQVELVISTLRLDAEADAATLSGGMKRRVVLARALVSEPDLLLLDEPTNHLDMDSIAWLEDFLIGQGRTLLFVTHDRMFLRKLATRIVELDRGRLYNWACNYDTWLERKAAALDAESAEWAREDKKLAEEEIWIRKGIKARRTRNEGRVRALKKLREERRARRERTGNVRFQLQEAEQSGKLVIETEGAGLAYNGRMIFKGLDTLIMRGDKVGIIGPNGCGKTTLLQVLLGILPPTEGRVRHGTRLQVAYFDQLRADIDDSKSVMDNVADGNDRISLNGKTRHVIGYLEDFLFSPDRARGPVTALSGGERNRLLLARLFAKPSNVLVMDEPTNDLDVETLELLEELLMEYVGTLLLVSHDRAFLNNVVTNTLVFEGDARVNEYVGGYDDWLWQRKPSEEVKPAKPAPEPKKQKPQTVRPRKLTFNEKKELDALPQKIESLENEQKSLYEVMALPVMNPADAERARKAKTRIDEIERELAEAFARWETLDALNRQSQSAP